MSQVNKFKQDQNPDYLYFDLQQTNIQNTTEFQQQPLRFIETRDNPIVANSGDYHLSVTRFQLDTYNLPVFVAEPDLTQTGTYDPNQTIYKVAMIPKYSNLVNGIDTNEDDFTYRSVINGETPQYGTAAYQFGAYIKTLYRDEKSFVTLAIAEPNNSTYWTSGGAIDIYTGTTLNNQKITELVARDPVNLAINYDNQKIGLRGIAMGEVSTSVVRVVASSESKGLILYEFDPAVQTPFVRIKSTINIIAGQITSVGISGNGNRIFVGNNSVSGGDYRVYTFNSSSGNWTQVGNTKSDAAPYLYQSGGFFDNTGTYVLVSAPENDGARGYVAMDYLVGNTWTSAPNQFSTATFGARLGTALAMGLDGTYCCASAIGASQINPFVNVYKRTAGTNNWTLITTITGVNSVFWGFSVSMSSDGSTISVGAITTKTIYTYRRGVGVETYSLIAINVGTPAGFGQAVQLNKLGTAFYTSDSLASLTTPNSVFIYEELEIPVGAVIDFPSGVKDVPVIVPLKWVNDYKDEVAPQKAVLTGKNTALYKYYYCNAYENFIKLVNNTIKDAYKALINELYTDWIVKLNNASMLNQFLDIVLKQYAPPPFLEWNEAELKADLYATLLFETNQYLIANGTVSSLSTDPVYTDYAVLQYTWASSGGNYVGTPLSPTPMKFEVAMNAPLYSLFNTLPAYKKVLTNSVGYRENYYILNFFTTGNDLVTPSIPLNQFIPYTFIGTYRNSSSVVTYPTQYTKDYSHPNKLIRQPQELSTIDTWTPINAIVFTTTSLPVVVNQFSATSSIGDLPPSTSTSNEFAFIITDIQSNEQGFRPNVLYSPSAQFRYIDMTGNQPIRNIDISIFWRSTTGALIPMVLASGAQASIKLLFEKKDKTGQKEANGVTIDKGSGFNSSI